MVLKNVAAAAQAKSRVEETREESIESGNSPDNGIRKKFKLKSLGMVPGPESVQVCEKRS